MTALAVWFKDYTRDLHAAMGGKASSLGEMTNAGLPVPPGFGITTKSYEEAARASSLAEHLTDYLSGLDVTDVWQLSDRCAKIRTVIREMTMPQSVEDTIRREYQALCDLSNVVDVPVAVRSSATSEDSPDASFAGEHDTYLWVRGADDVIDAVRRCWASLYTDRATAYREEMGYPHDSVEMCVVVQKMVHPKASGVAFTLNPADGDRSQIAIDSAWGFGEGVVAGEVTPDNFLVDKVMLEIGKRIVSNKEFEYALTDQDKVMKQRIDDDRATAPSLTDAEIKAIATLAKRAEKHYGCPQDIEWAIDKDLPEGENVILLQARPETVWSKKGVGTVTVSGQDQMASIIETLVSPLAARQKKA